MVVAHHVDSNWTLIKMTSPRTEGELIRDQHRILARMKKQGILPKHQVLDNEISAAYVADIGPTNMTYQLVLPDDHRRNIAERSIQTWKYNFFDVISCWSSTW